MTADNHAPKHLPPFEPRVDAAIWQLRSDFAALSIVARGARNVPSDHADAAVALATLPRIAPPWSDAHIESWREAYRSFGAKPQRTPCSAEALRKRVERDGSVPRVNAVVDLYNAVSVAYGLPIGGENAAAYVGSPRLVRAEGGETFTTLKDGLLVTEPVDAGEVVWRDDLGVTCRRWNWRQSPRTRLDEDTVEMWFVLERLEPMPLAALHDAAGTLVAGLRRLAPGARIDTTLIVA